ncbi:winged helix-turn-helix transcriptional regulator [Phytoactinopolyspora halotolerans]|uniref:Winged helix-turn-helix transcriptional regulator n=2 Tax=Phytoactinopolyspora halotolerans TaxID=1981512 RepID=A0A6L9SCK4_9ACTN|nr:winged helix-turn-helix transcriptional regulator [Phytoactinopolyspora halotolerans]
MPVTPQHVTPEHLKARLHGWRGRPGPLYLRLAEAIRALAEAGAVDTGSRLPSERALAATLTVSRNTVTAAYGQLRDDGWLIGRRGAAPHVGATTRARDGIDALTNPLANLFTTGTRPHLDLTIASPGVAPPFSTPSPALMCYCLSPPDRTPATTRLDTPSCSRPSRTSSAEMASTLAPTRSSSPTAVNRRWPGRRGTAPDTPTVCARGGDLSRNHRRGTPTRPQPTCRPARRCLRPTR